MIVLIIMGVLISLFVGAGLVVGYTQHVIKMHKRIPHYLWEVGVRNIQAED